MNSKPILASRKLYTVQELISSLQDIARMSPVKTDLVYLDMPVAAALLEETLTDGSKVYNLELINQEG
jgi:hypothetical protein